MSVVRTLSVSLTARTTKFNKGMKKAQRRLGKFGGALRGVARKLLSFKAALLGAVGVGGLGILLRRSAQNIDEQGKFAKRIGISIGALQALEVAAERSGVAIKAMRLGLQRMTRRVSEAAQGTGEAQKALKELRLDAAALNRLSPDQQFRAVAVAMKGVGSQADRVRLAMRLFDTEGVALVNTLALGAEGLDDARAFLKRFGVELTNLDVVRIEMARDAIRDVTRVAGLMFAKITVTLAPAVTVLARKLLDLGRDGEVSLGVRVVAGVQKLLGSIIELSDKIVSISLTMQLWFDKALVGLESMTASALMLAQKVSKALGVRVPGLDQELRESRRRLKSFAASVSEIENALLTLKFSESTVSRKLRLFFQEVEIEAKRAAAKADARLAKLRKGGATTGAGTSTEPDFGASAASKAEKAFTRAGEAGVSAFENIATSTAKATDAVKILISQMARIAINEFASKPLIGVIQDAAKGLFNGAAQESIDAENFVNDLTPNFSTPAQLVAVPQSTINAGITSSSQTQQLIGGIQNRSLYA